MRSTGDASKYPNWCHATIRATYVLSVIGAVILVAVARLSLAGFRTNVSYWEWLGRLITYVFCRLGGAFTKVGQVASTRYDVLPAPLLKQMQIIQDHVPPFGSGIARSIIANAFNRPIESVFQYFDDTPIASGTVAQIHYAIGHDGQELAVKVRRPGIEELFRIDAYLLRKLAAIAAAMPFYRSAPVIETASEIGDLLHGQTDFTTEARWQRLFRDSLARIPGLIVPRTVDDLCSGEVLTMEFLPGLHRLDDVSLPSTARRHAMLTTLRAIYVLIFREGLIHCDLHPGNIYLVICGDPVLLDFGFCGQMKERERRLFSEFFLCIAMNDSERAAKIVLEMAVAPPSPIFDEQAFRREIKEVVHEASGKRARNFLIGDFVLKLFGVQRRWSLRASSGFSQPLLSLLVFEGILRGLYPDLDFQREALPFVLADEYEQETEPLAAPCSNL